MKLSKGDVTYELRADDSKLESDINEANKKVEKAVGKSADEIVKTEKKKTEKLKEEADKVVKNSEESADKMADAWEEAGEDIKKSLDKIDINNQTIDVDANTGKAESKIKGVSKDKAIDVDVNADVSDAEESIEGLGDVADKVEEKINDNALGNIGSVLKSSLSDAADSSIPLIGKIGELTSGLSGTAAAAIGVGAAAVGMGVLSVGAANDMKGAMNDFFASTGIAKEQMITLADGTKEVIDNTDKYQGILEDIYKNNYGESFEDISNAMATVKTNMALLDNSSLQNVTESAFALRDTFEYDVAESTRAANTMMEQFGISGEEAMNMIATGAQNGLDYSGEFLDSINEYSVQFAKIGMGAEDMFKIFESGASSGAFNLDKIGDAVKEMSIRVIDGSDTTKQGFELIGMNADEMASKFSAGGESAKEAFYQTIDALAAMEDPIAQNTAGVDLFGTMWEDLGPEAVTALSDIQDGVYQTSDAMNQIKDVKYDDLGSMFEELKRNIEVLLIPLGEALLPVLSSLIDSVLPILTGLLGPLISLFAELLTPILNLIQQALQPLMDAFLFLMDNVISPFISLVTGLLVPAFSGALDGMLKTAKNNIGNITNIFRNIIDFVKNVFTGDWKAAWQNVKDIFKNIIEGLGNIFKSPLNFIIDGINGFLGGLNKIKIPDWVPGVGGKGFNIPKIPRLKVGMDYVPNDFFPAFLDEGEWVLTKEEANLLRSLGGLEGMVAMSGSLRSDSVNVNVQGGTEIDYVRLGNSVADALIRSEVAFKCDERVFGRLVKDVK